MVKKKLNCPSSSPESMNATVFAVVIGSVEKPEVKYLKKQVEVTEALLASTAPVSPTEVFRFTSPCAEKKCGHYDSNSEKCSLVERTVQFVSPATDELFSCAIRKNCVWWSQQGKEACFRCSSVVRDGYPLTVENVKSSIPIDI